MSVSFTAPINNRRFPSLHSVQLKIRLANSNLIVELERVIHSQDPINVKSDLDFTCDECRSSKRIPCRCKVAVIQTLRGANAEVLLARRQFSRLKFE